MTSTPDTKKLKLLFKKNVYSSLSGARTEILRRRKDKKLCAEVELFLQHDLPEIFHGRPKAILARNIVTPNKAFFEFKRLAKKIGFQDWCLEYTHDKFRAENPDKYYLGRLHFNEGKDKNGTLKISTMKMIDFNQAEGKKICDIQTLWGETLVDAHHALASDASRMPLRYCDASEWIARKGKKAENFYPAYLSLFLCHGVLFENFLLDNKSLVYDLFLPALDKLQKNFGLKPLIVPLISVEKESQYSQMLHYRAQMKDEVKAYSLAR